MLVLKGAGGMDDTAVSPTVRNCTFRNNRGAALARAMINSSSSAIVDQYVFHNNNANSAVLIGRTRAGIASGPGDAAGVRQLFECVQGIP